MSTSLENLEAERAALPAWGVSLLVHGSAVLLLLYAAQNWPVGGSERGGEQSIGIVLNQSSDQDSLRDGDGGEGEDRYDPYRMKPMVEPPALIQEPTPTVKTATQVQREPTKLVPVRLAAVPVGESKEHSKEAQPPTGGGLGRSGRPGGTGYATTSVFGVEGHGNKFVYLFDRSASMEGPPLSSAKKQLLASLQHLDDVNQFQIIFFNSKTRMFDATGGSRRIAFASDRNKQLAANFVGGITADGGTDRIVALRDAISLMPNVIFFLTDADDPMSESEMAEVTRLNQRAQAAICVIEFGRKPAPTPDNFLMQLARESGGKYGFVDTTKLTSAGRQAK
jgi:hypothetical protein